VRLRRFIASVCIGLFVVVGLKTLYDHAVLRTVFDCHYRECRPGEDGSMTNSTDDGWFTVPAAHAKPTEVWSVAYDTCASQSAAALSRVFVWPTIEKDGQVLGGRRTRPTAEAVARSYADMSGGRSLVYEGCLHGFRTGLASGPWHDSLVALLAIAAVFAGVFSVPEGPKLRNLESVP
jgi:hypothetical protein